MRGLSAFVVLLLLTSCAREGIEIEGQHPLPRLGVQLEVSLDHEGRGLREPLSYMLFERATLEGQYLGHRGIVVAHEAGGRYCAFDLACPHCWPTVIGVEMVQDGSRLLAAECPRCHTVYDLSLGLAHPVSGEGHYPLQDYRVTQVGEHLVVR
ncbi:hypothetical protein [Porphyromonas levii]|uniref:hypothetical protein n=1 Tax=Porphyromonas levii TaxID=28114 RepID=UPI0003728107|nr:hypothetical protein [Porphyromonas levii]MBR8703713.1 hypothetical protein [Porphyromonas levii]MBR8765185.1 hypothetical protein [Porphyromonas levii]MBR8784712.1 hypothetical protein [Porphyromonas levii]MBR8801792.1 hypothetical protein [Porphyromonas levii]